MATKCLVNNSVSSPHLRLVHARAFVAHHERASVAGEARTLHAGGSFHNFDPVKPAPRTQHVQMFDEF